METVDWQSKYLGLLEETKKTIELSNDIAIRIALAKRQLAELRVKIYDLKITLGSSSI